MGVGGHRDTWLRGLGRVPSATNWRIKSIFHGLQHAPKNFIGDPAQGAFLRPVPLLFTGIPTEIHDMITDIGPIIANLKTVEICTGKTER